MKKSTWGVIAVAALLVAAVLYEARGAAAKPQATCPVTGQAIDVRTSPHVDWQGQRIYFADTSAVETFRKDPEGVFAKIAADGVALENVQTTCPVSGEPLAGAASGAPITVSYKGRTVRFCCTKCPPRFEEDPDGYLAKLPGEQPPSS